MYENEKCMDDNDDGEEEEVRRGWIKGMMIVREREREG